MKLKFLLMSVIVAGGVAEYSVASPLCDKLKIPASRLAKFRPHDAHGKLLHGSMGDAVACFDANWDKLSSRLTYRGSTTDSLFVRPAVSQAPVQTVRYSPAAMYNANAATPVAFLTRPVVNVNYLPSNGLSSSQVMAQVHRLAAPRLMDEVASTNYQGSLPTPVVYQTGQWNADFNR